METNEQSEPRVTQNDHVKVAAWNTVPHRAKHALSLHFLTGKDWNYCAMSPVCTPAFCPKSGAHAAKKLRKTEDRLASGTCTWLVNCEAKPISRQGMSVHMESSQATKNHGMITATWKSLENNKSHSMPFQQRPNSPKLCRWKPGLTCWLILSFLPFCLWKIFWKSSRVHLSPGKAPMSLRIKIWGFRSKSTAV